MKNVLAALSGIALALSASTCSYAAAPTKADNTEQNLGALDKNAVTADKQGNRRGEVKTLAKVRRSIERARGLSFNAKNVKILCDKGGEITLRGPVDNDTERLRVEQLARACTGVTNVHSELTVAPK